MAEYIESSGVVFHYLEEAHDIVVENGAVAGLITDRATYRSKNIIMAPGRVGAEWVGQLAKKNPAERNRILEQYAKRTAE